MAMIGLAIGIATASEPTPALVEASPNEPIPGVTISWRAEDCALRARITNAGKQPAAIDWFQSTMTESNGHAVGLVAGLSPTDAGQVDLPVTVAPAGSFTDVWLFRRDRLPSDSSAGCMYAVPSTLMITLRINRAWAAQQLDLSVDEATVEWRASQAARRRSLDDDQDDLRRLAAEEAECRANRRSTDTQIMKERRRSRIFGGAFAGGTVGLLGIAGLEAASGNRADTTLFASLSVGTAVAGGVLYFLYKGRADALENAPEWDGC